jgi:hypothetical protein
VEITTLIVPGENDARLKWRSSRAGLQASKVDTAAYNEIFPEIQDDRQAATDIASCAG